jgi:hypothetical protein
MANIRKITMRITEREIIQNLQRAGDKYAPLTIKRFGEQISLPEGYRVDAIIEFSIQNGPSFEAVVEFAPVPTPRNILRRAQQLADYFSKYKKPKTVPLVIAPYIDTKQAKILGDKGISWIDLSGNMYIRVSNQIYIERTGRRNRFPDTAPIKKIFQGTSSLVSRALLLKPEGFSSLYEVVDFINERNASITLSTVSKVLKSLEEELLIDKSKSTISVTNREKLLEKLTESYISSTERKSRETYRFATESIDKMFFDLYQRQLVYVACGFYAAQIKGLAVTDQITIFVKDMEQVRIATKQNWIKITPDAEFGNVSITETKYPGVWFNTPFPMYQSDTVIDDIELYLEMMADTPRGPKIAGQLKQRILRGDADG